MTSHMDQINRWLDVHEGSSKPYFSRGRCNVFASSVTGQLYSYGEHFPLAVSLLGRVVLMNGDRYSISTGRHQSLLRQAVSERGLRHLIVPFSALYAAGVSLDSIELLDSLPDRTVWVPRTVQDEPSSYVRNVVENPDGTYTGEYPQHRLGESLFRAEVAVAGGGWRTAYFLSAWDHQDTDCYFLSELPHMVGSLADAYEALKPAIVKHAESQGRTVRRQGDVFAIELPYTTRELKRMGASPVERGGRLLGTNHYGTETLMLANVTLARGTLRHRPEGRPSDHRMVKLGKAWHLVAKNTVPVYESAPADRVA